MQETKRKFLVYISGRANIKKCQFCGSSKTVKTISDIPLCKKCGKKLLKSYLGKGGF
jgi:ribosomal protein L37AE/L43A